MTIQYELWLKDRMPAHTNWAQITKFRIKKQRKNNNWLDQKRINCLAYTYIRHERIVYFGGLSAAWIQFRLNSVIIASD